MILGLAAPGAEKIGELDLNMVCVFSSEYSRGQKGKKLSLD